MASNSAAAGNSQMAQLEAVRQMALVDPSNYKSVLTQIIPIFKSQNNPSPALRAWGADFIAEAFSSPAWTAQDKQEVSIPALPVLREMLELPPGQQSVPISQTSMIKSVIQAASSIYPHVFRHIIRNPDDTESWQMMSAIKSNILRRMDSEHPGVRICCIRFIERVVQTQTPGVIADPRRPETNETSLALVPPDHPVLKTQSLEAEAHGLLDRALGILQENHSDALLVTATLNGLGGLIRTRATIANRILNAVINFNPFRLANSPMTPANKLMIKSMEKTVVIFLQHIMKRAPQHPMMARMEAHIIRLQQMRKEILDNSGLKRPAEEASDMADPAKRQRVNVPPPMPIGVPPLPSHRPISVAELFTLTDDQRALNMNVKAIPPDMAAPVLVSLLRDHVNRETLHHAVNTVRTRYQQVTAPMQPPIQTDTPLDDEDDYEPDFFPTEDAEQIKNRLEADADMPLVRTVPESVAVYRLPKPPPMMPAQIDSLAYAVSDRMFENLARLMATKELRDNKRGFQDSVLRGSMDFQAYFRMIVRLAIRPFASPDGDVKNGTTGDSSQTPLTDYVRQRLLQFVLSDWQRRIAFAVTWFTEEYVAEIFIHSSPNSDSDGAVKPVSVSTASNYKRWLLRFLSDLSVYLGSGKQDLKFLVRFVSEIPLLDEEILKKIAHFADDPERVSTVSAAVRYLVSYRPSVREAALDALETVWRYEGHAKESPNAKMLTKFRPQMVERILSMVEATA
ncbi:uncharacterized protein PV09_01679 [Verruconis gallopava]|uniref:Symplekin/Pta1 N-terminal domain-containing protein n=1 Tax=Verruconis gallopava TaxID=253628 RepID=A0A0D2AMN0_9PEZI|nr:uncharacterized protein PV09_01679 [Verruconis gallopava]KIW07750.1 hypothetical protein PV09_01679 [Verruconis gallopava]